MLSKAALWRRRLIEFGVLGPPLAVVMLVGGIWASQLDLNSSIPAAVEWWWNVLNRKSSEYVLWSKVSADAKLTKNVAAAIKTIEPDVQRQPAAIAHFAHDFIEYDSDTDVWGKIDYVGSVTEMEAMRKKRGWTRMRGDCDDIAVWYASVASALGIPYRFEHTSDHIWVELRSGQTWLSVESNGSMGAAAEVPRWRTHDRTGVIDDRRQSDPAFEQAYQFLTRQPERTLHLFHEWNMRTRMHATFVGAVISGLLAVLPLILVSTRLIRGSRLKRYVEATA